MGSSEIQGKLWGVKAEDYSKLNEPTNKMLWEAMLSAAEVGKDTKFLDVGCGGGGAILLATKLGAKVSGLDASENFIKIAHQRVPEGEFRVGDMENLPYDDNSFDVTFSALTLMFADNPSIALQEMKRVTAPSGRVVVGLWGPPENCDLGHISKAVIDFLPAPKPKGKVFSLSAPKLLEGLMQQAGFKVLGSNEVKCPFEFPNFETCWRSLSSAGAMQALMHITNEETLKKVVLAAIEPFQDKDGVIRLENLNRYVLANP